MSKLKKPADVRSLTAQSAKSFDAELHTAEYEATHADSDQLAQLISLLQPGDKQNILDLGTGAGYVAIALAKQFPTAEVVGLDIAEQAVRKDAQNAAKQGYSNIHFITFDGVNLPFGNETFGQVVSRYAYHHFPYPEITLSELSRILLPSGRLVISDAVRDDLDEADFINQFQSLKPDGHVEMLRAGKLVELFNQLRFELQASFQSSLSFERATNADYDSLLRSTTPETLDAYGVSVTGDQIHLTFPIFSAVFVKSGTPSDS